MYFLDKLCQGKILPGERTIIEGSEYDKLSKEMCRELDVLTQTISSEQKALLRKIDDLYMAIRCIDEQEVFVEGFRLGAGMILDVVGGHSNQFHFSEEV